jgi:hypothetical protein
MRLHTCPSALSSHDAAPLLLCCCRASHMLHVGPAETVMTPLWQRELSRVSRQSGVLEKKQQTHKSYARRLPHSSTRPLCFYRVGSRSDTLVDDSRLTDLTWAAPSYKRKERSKSGITSKSTAGDLCLSARAMMRLMYGLTG